MTKIKSDSHGLLEIAEAAVRSVPVTESIRYQHGPYYRVPDYWLQFMKWFTREKAPGFPTTAHLMSTDINEYLVSYNARLIEEGYASYTLIFESQQDYAFFLLKFS